MLVDYYTILGVRRNASTEQIKKAYRQQAKSLHPDVSDDILATAKFQLLNEAYQILISARKRRIYDFNLRHNIEFVNKRRRPGGYSYPYYSNYQYYTYQNHWAAKNRNRTTETPYKKKLLDNVLFYSLLIIGLIGIIFGIFDIFYKEWMGLSNLNGIFFSLSFTIILIYGWRILGKKTN